MTRGLPGKPITRGLKVALPPELHARLHDAADRYVMGVNLLAVKAIEFYLDELDRRPRDPLQPQE